MSEQKNRKDPIEDFFEQKAWDYDISYNKADWEKLEKQLDALDNERYSRIWRRGIAAAVLLLFSLLGYFTYQNYSQLKHISELLDAENQQNIQQLENERIEAAPPVQTRDLNNQPSASGNKLSAESNSTQLAQANSNSSKVSEESSEPVESNRTNIAELKVISGLSGGDTDQFLFINEISCLNCGMTQTEMAKYTSSLEFIASVRPATGSSSSNLVVNQSGAGPFNTDLNSSYESSDSPKLSFGVLLGPDLSTTSFFSSFYEPGYTIGIHAEYHLTNRLSLRAGVQQSKVRYTAGSNDYRPPYGYWTNGIAADQTLADCILLDIPLNLKYSFLEFKNSRLYTTAGLSSYIMLNEEYQFNYDDQQSGRVQSWNAKTGTSHWLSNASFSLGYELDVHRNWSVRAEPYVKIPLKEVGWGNVDLYSTGSFLTLNYKLQ